MAKEKEMAMEPQSTIRIEKTIRNAPIEMVEGDVDDMVMSKRPGRPPKKTVDQGPVEEAERDQFAELLQDQTVRIHVDRVSPREWEEKQISGMIEEYVPPTTVEEIETDVRQRFGGGRYRIRILKSGRFLGARGISIYGDPKIMKDEDETELPAFEDFDVPRRPGRFSYTGYPPGVEHGDDEIVNLRKQIEKERLKSVLKEVKGEEIPHLRGPDTEVVRKEAEDRVRRELQYKNDISDMRHDVDQRFQAFMDTVKELLGPGREKSAADNVQIIQLDNKIERIKTELLGEVKATFAGIESKLANLVAVPKQDNTPALFHAMIEGFGKIAQSGDAKVQTMAEAERFKTEAMMSSLREINDANSRVAQVQAEKMLMVLQQMSGGNGGIDNVAKTVGVVRDIAETMGFVPGSAAEPQEPQDIGSRIMGLVEKALPTLLIAQRNKEQRTGAPTLTREEIQAIIAQKAREAASRIIQQTPQPQPQSRPALPPAVPVQVQPQPTTQPPPVQSTPQPVAVETVPATVQTFENTGPEPAREMTIEEEKIARVNDCLSRLLREIRIRPRSPSWNEYAFDHLPGEVLDQLVMVTDAEGLENTIAPYAEPQSLEEIKSILADDKKAVDWMVRGLNEMKDWYLEEQQTSQGNGAQESQDDGQGDGAQESENVATT